MYYAIMYIANVIFVALSTRAACKILDMRSNTIYALAVFAILVTVFLITPIKELYLVKALLLDPLHMFVLPIAMSRGKLSTRLVRIALLTAGLVVPELAAAGTYSLLTGSFAFPTPSSMQLLPYALSYVAAIVFQFITTEAIIAICGRSTFRSTRLSAPDAPVIALLLGTYLFGWPLVLRLNDTHANEPLVAIGLLAIAALTVGLSLLTIAFTQRELQVSQQRTDEAALVRQLRHIRSELLSIAGTSAEMRRFRHDLANQSQTILELVRQGHFDIASQSIRDLQERAATLTGGSHE